MMMTMMVMRETVKDIHTHHTAAGMMDIRGKIRYIHTCSTYLQLDCKSNMKVRWG